MDKLNDIGEAQRASWNKYSSGWKKWDHLTMDFLAPVGNEIIKKLDLQGGETILDVASGTGEPGLSIARRLNEGHVVMTDIADEMLNIARENAKKAGISNIKTIAGDICQNSFSDNSFDGISCRFGYMFFPDLTLATQELYRVLKPGGKIALAVWNVPEKNFWVTAIMKRIRENMHIPIPDEDAPGIFRCAKEGLMASLLTNSGFKQVGQTEVLGCLNTGTSDQYWEMTLDVGAPIAAAYSNADELTQQKIKQEVYQDLHEKYPDGKVNITSSALVFHAIK